MGDQITKKVVEICTHPLPELCYCSFVGTLSNPICFIHELLEERKSSASSIFILANFANKKTESIEAAV